MMGEKSWLELAETVSYKQTRHVRWDFLKSDICRNPFQGPIVTWWRLWNL